MPILSSAGIKTTGFGYIPPPLPVTNLNVTTTYSSGHVATITWTASTSPNIEKSYVRWYVGGASVPVVTLAGNVTSAIRSVTGGASVSAAVWVENAGAKQSTEVTSNTVITPPEPATLTATEDGPGFVDLSWAIPTGGTNVTINRTISGVTTNVVTNSTATSVNNDPAGGSSDVVYSIFSTNAGGNGPTTTTSIRTTPKVPTNPVITAVNPGTLNYAFTGVTPTPTRYDVALITGASVGATQSVGLNTTGTLSNSAVHGTSYSFRVRTVDGFGQISAWATSSSVSGANDTTPPTVPTPTVTQTGLPYGWNNTSKGFTLNWTAITDPQGSTVTSASLQVSYNNGSSWSDIHTISSPGSSGSYLHVVPIGNRNNANIKYRIFATDQYGNSQQGGGVVTLVSKPYGNFDILAVQGKTWETGGTASWRSDANAITKMYSNYFDSTHAWQYGYWFYNQDAQTDQTNSIAAVCKGYTPDSGSLTIRKVRGAGQPGYFHVALHTYNAYAPFGVPITPNLNGYFNEENGVEIVDRTLSEGANEFDSYFSMPAAWLTAFANGTAKGVVLPTNAGLYGNTSDQYYRVVYNPTGYSLSGRIGFAFT